MQLYKSFKGEESEQPIVSVVEQSEEFFNPVELEQAFNRAYRSYRINGSSRMDVDTFFDRMGKISLIPSLEN